MAKRWWKRAAFRMRAWFGRRRLDRELTEEVEFHLEKEAEKLRASGLSDEQARAEALRRFGGVDRYREQTHDAWGGDALAATLLDLRYALRQVRRRPTFAALTIGTLGLGIGVGTALLGVTDALLLRALPFEHGDRMVAFWSAYDWRMAEFDVLRELELEAIERPAAFTLDGGTLQAGEGSTMLLKGLVTPDAFEIIGARPLLGRAFTADEHAPGAEAVAVLSHGLWQQELGGDPDVIGRRLEMDGQSVTVVGVMPPGFYFPMPEARIWQPLEVAPGTPVYNGRGWLVMTGRLRPGASTAAMDRDLARITTALRERFDYPAQWDKTQNPSFEPLRHHLLGETRPALLLLLGAVGLLLATALSNVGALLLARTSDRAGELALRSGLGAGRGRIARQMLAEGAVLGLAAGFVGAALAAALHGLLARSLGVGGGLDQLLTLDGRVLAVGVVASVALGVLITLVPLRDVLRGRLAPALGGSRPVGGTKHNQRLQAVLVTAQVALAVTLVTGATLLVRSVDRLLDVDLGLEPEGVVVADVFLGVRTNEERRQYFTDLTDRIEALEGVDRAGTILRLPIREAGLQGPMRIEDRPELSDTESPGAYYRSIMPGTLDALGTRLTRGRGFEAADRAGGVQVSLVSESFAAEVWPGDDPIGKRLSPIGFEGENWTTVVGVVEDVRYEGPTADPPRAVYRPFAQATPWPNQTLVVRASGRDAGALIGEIRREAVALDPLAAVHRTSSMEQVVRAAIGRPLRLRLFLGLFGVMALGLGMVGVFGVVSYAVARRQREYGLRLALGAEPARVTRTVVRHGMTPVVLGVAVGVGVSLALGGVLSGFLFGVPSSDPVSFTASVAVLLAAGVVAALAPAFRAGRVDPVEALRAE